KIVVFDRIRSGLRDRLSGSVAEVMNTSINETLSRTILTGGTVLLTVLALYFFGGPVLNDFAFSFLIGVIVGTYSSIFIASPIVLWWTRARGRDTSALRSEVIQQTLTICGLDYKSYLPKSSQSAIVGKGPAGRGQGILAKSFTSSAL